MTNRTHRKLMQELRAEAETLREHAEQRKQRARLDHLNAFQRAMPDHPALVRFVGRVHAWLAAETQERYAAEGRGVLPEGFRSSAEIGEELDAAYFELDAIIEAWWQETARYGTE